MDNFNEVVKKYESLGAIVEEVSVDKELLKAISPVYFTISCAEATSNNSNLTGVAFGPRAGGEKASEMIFNARTKGFSELIKRRFVIGSYVLQKENQEKLFLNAGRIRRMIVNKFSDLFEEYDAMILPGAGTVAPKFKSENIDKLSDRYLILENHMQIANFGGFPSITIPTGFVNGLPVGVSITSGIKKDNVLLNIAYNLENVMEYKGQIAGGRK
jgi:aspartyl-tRNA(Asn)/glutamyl-tRNA(Gln) amidotransferase subunit A